MLDRGNLDVVLELLESAEETDLDVNAATEVTCVAHS